MAGTTSNWEDELGRWLKPFLDRLGHKARRQMCPLYVAGLIGTGDRKGVQPMTERLALGHYDRPHHSFRPASGMPCHWRRSCSFKRTARRWRQCGVGDSTITLCRRRARIRSGSRLNSLVVDSSRRPGRASSSRPSQRSFKNRRRHLPTVCSWRPSSAATSLLATPSAHPICALSATAKE